VRGTFDGELPGLLNAVGHRAPGDFRSDEAIDIRKVTPGSAGLYAFFWGTSDVPRSSCCVERMGRLVLTTAVGVPYLHGERDKNIGEPLASEVSAPEQFKRVPGTR
jgi:hypothetical protein